MAGDPDGGLESSTSSPLVGDLDGYHLLEATRADLLRRLGDLAAAADAYKGRWSWLRPSPSGGS